MVESETNSSGREVIENSGICRLLHGAVPNFRGFVTRISEKTGFIRVLSEAWADLADILRFLGPYLAANPNKEDLASNLRPRIDCSPAHWGRCSPSAVDQSLQAAIGNEG